MNPFLNRHFILATTLNTPCSTNDIISAISYVVKYVERVRKQRGSDPVVHDQSGPDSTKRLYGEFKIIPKAVFQKIEELGLLQKKIGGGAYATTFRPQTLDEKYFYPNNEKITEKIHALVRDLKEEQSSRYHRIGLLSFHILSALGFSGPFLESAKSAAFLYSVGFFNGSKFADSAEYLSNDKLVVRKEVCSLIKDSLLSFRDLNDATAETIMKSIGKLIGEEESPSNEPTSLAASAIATADAVDRIIFQRGVFQPVAAYCILSKLKRETISFIHPLVLAILVKTLAEAVTSEAAGIARNKRFKQMSQFIQAAGAIDDIIIRQDECSVALGNLAPGMMLSRPINTYDGRPLLEETMQLDQDLIWRLWQLAAIRPIQKNIVVSK